jgi:hypothetical protein
MTLPPKTVGTRPIWQKKAAPRLLGDAWRQAAPEYQEYPSRIGSQETQNG